MAVTCVVLTAVRLAAAQITHVGVLVYNTQLYSMGYVKASKYINVYKALESWDFFAGWFLAGRLSTKVWFLIRLAFLFYVTIDSIS